MVKGGEAVVAGDGGRRRVEGRESSVEAGGRGAAKRGRAGVSPAMEKTCSRRLVDGNDHRRDACATWERADGDGGVPGVR